MPKRAIEPDRETELRLRALSQITGRADPKSPRANSAAALGVLYQMASSPATAVDALALLHEIQVHQVEVQIQDEELRRSRAELDVILARYIQLYDMAAFGHFTVDGGTAICEVNLAGARLFGASRDALVGRRLEQLVAPKSVGVLRAMLADVRSGTPMRTRTLHLATEASTQALHARASADTVNGRFLVALLDAGAAPGVPGQA